MQRIGTLRLFACTIAVVFCVGAAARAQDAGNVLLVVNEKSTRSEEVAAHYVKARGLPSDNLLRISTEPVDQIDRSVYEHDIERPIADWIIDRLAHDRILYILLTKDVPLRIRGTAGRNGSTASVDSELTVLYRKLSGAEVSTVGPIPNPYFRGGRQLDELRRFTHIDQDIFLVSRLDGFSTEDVRKLINTGMAPIRDGRILLDQKGTSADRIGDSWLRQSVDAISSAGYTGQVVLESTTDGLTDSPRVLGYFSWGSNDPALHRRRLALGFFPGAIASTFVSTGARTFKEPSENWAPGSSAAGANFEGSSQSLIGDLIREGVTGAAGHVAEPYLDGSVRPDVLFPAYVSGFNLVESFYLATPYLSWQTIIVGDPLCSPFAREAPTADSTNPPLDPETGLPKYFADRSLSAMTSRGLTTDNAKLLLKAEVRKRRGDIAGAREALEAVTASEPRLTIAHLALASIFEDAHEYDLAIDRYRRALAASPNEPISLNNLAYALAVQKGSPSEALPLAEKAYALTSRNALMADTLGWIHYLLGHIPEAEKFLLQAAEGAPHHPEINFHLARIYEASGRYDEALAALSRALASSPALTDRHDVRTLQERLRVRPNP